MVDLLCPGGEQNCRLFDDAGAPIQWDNGHLTPRGSAELMRKAFSESDLRLPAS